MVLVVKDVVFFKLNVILRFDDGLYSCFESNGTNSEQQLRGHNTTVYRMKFMNIVVVTIFYIVRSIFYIL